MHSSLDDEKLAELSRTGDVDAFDALMRRWEKKMFALCYGIMGNAEDAHDAVQEAFQSAFKTIGRFRGDSKFSSWIHRIAVNACITQKRKGKRLAESGFESTDGASWEPVAPEIGSNPLLHLERAELTSAVRAAISSLPEEIRLAVLMKEFQNLTFQEISDTLELPLSTVKSRVYTGFKLLRDKLSNRNAT